MRRDSIDFHAVLEAHQAIHARLEDWARWCKPPPRSECSPMFRQYRSTDVHQGASAALKLNTLDCQKIEKAVAALEMQQAQALRWSYVTKRSPVMACRSIGCTLVELVQLVKDGRQELIDRRV